VTRWLLAVSAALAWLFAAMLLFAARQFEAPIGIDVTDKVATIAQAQGAVLAGIGAINFFARRVVDPAAVRAVLGGNLVVQVLSLGVAGRALALGIFPVAAAPSAAFHLILGALFAVALARVPAPGAAAEAK
jgi:hypothetical protein